MCSCVFDNKYQSARRFMNMKMSRIDNYGMKRLVLTLKSFVQSEGQQIQSMVCFFVQPTS